MTRLAAAAMFLALLSVPAPAQETAERPAADIRLRRLENESGPSHNSIFSITQDRRGFLWIGTQDGLNRFDGYEFVVFRHDPRDRGSVASNWIEAVLEDRSGNLWVGTAVGVNRFDRSQNRFIRYALVGETGVEPRVRTILEDSAGTLWLGTGAGLFRYDVESDRWVEVHFSPTATGADVHRLQEDTSGNLWLLAREVGNDTISLWLLPSDGNEAKQFSVGPEWGNVRSFVIDVDGSVWLDDSGPAVLDEDRGEARRRNSAAAPQAGPTPLDRVTSAAYQDERGTLWVGGSPRGVYRYDPMTGHGTHVPIEDSETNPLVRQVGAIYRSRSGIVWVGTENGLYRHDPQRKPFVHHPQERDRGGWPSSGPVMAVLEDSSGALWVGTLGGGLSRRSPDRGGWVTYLQRPGEPMFLDDDSVWSLHVSDEVIWVGGRGLCELEPSTEHLGCYDPAGNRSPIQSIAEDAQGLLWLAVDGGIIRFDPRSGASQLFPYGGEPESPESRAFMYLLPDGDDTLWAATFAGALKRFDTRQGRFVVIPRADADGWEQTSPVFDLHLDDAGALWMGSGDGLSRFDRATRTFRHYSERDGLPGTNVFSILEDDDGRLWLGTNRGLSRFDDRLAEGRRFRNFGRSDGVLNGEFNRSAATRTADGGLIFGGIDGLTEFHPAAIRDNPFVPPVALTRIQVFGRDGNREVQPYGLDRLTLPHDDNSFSFDFVAPSYTDPASNRYAYQLEGLDEEWVESGARRFARYTRVSAGRYVFRVKASNNDGVWSQEHRLLSLTITPPFWQTWWFRFTVFALIAGLLTAAYRYRVARLLELERLRVRIASDLHDELSSDVTSIALVTDMMRRSGQLGADERKQLVEVRDTAVQMIDSLRDIVWYINPEHDNLDAMLRRMQSVAAGLLAGVDYRFETSIDGGEIDLGLRRDFFLIYKELLHNIVKHARAGCVDIRLEQRDGELVLRVADDGVGFDVDARGSGNGLASMRRRAEQMGAEFSIESLPAQGSRASLTVKMARTRDRTAP